MSKLITLNADGTAATVAEAKISDILTTLMSGQSAVTGIYGFIQRALLVATGMSVQSMRSGGGLFGWLKFGDEPAGS